MYTRPNFIGSLQRDIDVAYEYKRLAVEDENAGQVLLENGNFRQAAYCFIQSMEKLVRHRIFLLVNASLPYFQERTRTHNLDELLNFLIEIASSKDTVREQVKQMLEQQVLQGVRFGKLHNDLRYPMFSEKTRDYALLQVLRPDAEHLQKKLGQLKSFLKDFDRFSRT